MIDVVATPVLCDIVQNEQEKKYYYHYFLETTCKKCV